MTVSERRRAIMEILQDKGFVKITDISSAFDVSNETARRDLDFLQGQQLIHRTHGGAIPVTAENRQKSTKIPLSSGDNVVRALAAATSKLIKPGETIYLGNGSTMREVARYQIINDQYALLYSCFSNASQLLFERAKTSLHQ